jgi:hypothetical protein
MRIMVKAAPVVLAVLLGSAASAMAADFCVAIAGGTSTIAAKAFTLPTRGMCRDYRGFYTPVPGQHGPSWVRGTACGSSDNLGITFFDTAHAEDGASIVTDKFFLSRSTLTGAGTNCLLNTNGWTCAPSLNYARVACSPLVVPVPE